MAQRDLFPACTFAKQIVQSAASHKCKQIQHSSIFFTEIEYNKFILHDCVYRKEAKLEFNGPINQCNNKNSKTLNLKKARKHYYRDNNVVRPEAEFSKQNLWYTYDLGVEY